MGAPSYVSGAPYSKHMICPIFEANHWSSVLGQIFGFYNFCINHTCEFQNRKSGKFQENTLQKHSKIFHSEKKSAGLDKKRISSRQASTISYLLSWT